jgi:hypothetical protein
MSVSLRFFVRRRLDTIVMPSPFAPIFEGFRKPVWVLWLIPLITRVDWIGTSAFSALRGAGATLAFVFIPSV